ncbi:DUF885 domain-containing protein [Mucilaginibacter roseus]|uniref:DUF885 domain-containing protein n=1 Tax=Mucilaginibacter roseus TaxID=1528868 RepID=A0ABS8TX01_9SPHI|nr:DUF885 domain-containing protein [Mucilaginibacter roseus]MCD8739356.1 DUF885 domain-containing protein [Mucilaginibacter roseus]
MRNQSTISIKVAQLIFSLVLTYWGSAMAAFAQSDPIKLKGIFKEYQEDNLKLHPINATFSGDHRYDGELANDISQAFIKTSVNVDKKYLRRLQSIKRDRLSIADQISYDVLKQILQTDMDAANHHLEYLPVNQFSSIPLLIGQLGSGQSAQPFRNLKDYENWIKRINAFQLWADTAIANMRKGMASGVVLPKILVNRMIPQMEDLGKNDTSANVFFGPLNRIPSAISGETRKQVQRKLSKALTMVLLPAYHRMALFLKNEYLPAATDSAGLSGIPGGSAMYRYYIQLFTTTNKTPDEIYDLGLKEVTRIKLQMEAIKSKTGFKGSMQDFNQFLKTDPRFMPFKNAEEVLQAYRNVYQTVKPHLSELFSLFPKSKFEIRRVEAFREASQNGPSYAIGSLDGSRPGIFYVPVPDATKINIVTLGLEATFIHEAIPGHHYQISLQQENISLPAFRRQISFSAFTEGWGLYTESLGKQLGCYTDPYQEMGALNNELLRAIRLVADVGLHAGKMSKEQVIDYMLANQSISLADATSATERYMAMPGQALSYKVGELEMIRIREKCKARLGKQFKLIRFHDALLSQGDMPLTVLERYMDTWIKNEKARTAPKHK